MDLDILGLEWEPVPRRLMHVAKVGGMSIHVWRECRRCGELDEQGCVGTFCVRRTCPHVPTFRASVGGQGRRTSFHRTREKAVRKAIGSVKTAKRSAERKAREHLERVERAGGFLAAVESLQ